MSEPGWVPLLTLDHEDGTAAVYRDGDGRHWLSSTGEGGTELEGHEPALEGLEGDTVIVGGVVPDEATEALYRDARGEMCPATVGGGAWLARIEDHDMFAGVPVLFRDADGAIVPQALPAGATTEPIPDASETCPACGASEWERAAWTHRWDEERIEEERTALRCVRCGNSTGGGMTFQASIAIADEDADDLDLDEPSLDEWLEPHRRAARNAFVDAEFPVYGLGPSWGGSRSFGGWSSQSEGITAMELQHGDARLARAHVEVETTVTPDDWQTDRELCVDALCAKLFDRGPDLPIDRSDGATSLWFSARQRELRERAARAASDTVDLGVDGEPTPFYRVADGDVWAACGRVPGARILVTSVGVPPTEVELVTVTDPDAYV